MRVTRIHYSRSDKALILDFSDGTQGTLSAEFLRVHSPSAEVRGHGPGQVTLVSGKADVAISEIHAVGHYAIQPVFDDGHDSGIFTWQYLRDLVDEQQQRWDRYLEALSIAGLSRQPEVQVLTFEP